MTEWMDGWDGYAIVITYCYSNIVLIGIVTTISSNSINWFGNIYWYFYFFNPFKPEFTLSSSSSTSRELLSQFSTCSE